MGVVIASTALCPADDTASAIGYAARAGGDCLTRAGLTPADVDVLINVGVYRDSNVSEPSVAALVQKRIGIHPDYARGPGGSRTAFSFDLMNGACGTLNAVQAADALLATGSAERVLVVSADTHPSMDQARAGTPAFPYASTGAALLLQRGDDALGFGRVHHRALPGPHGVNGYLPVSEAGPHGRGAIAVDRDADVLERMLGLAADTARGCLAAEYGTDRAEVTPAAFDRTLLITSQPSPAFASSLAKRLGLPADAAVTVEGVHGDPHTSALAYGLRQAQDAGRLEGHDRILFLAVGAGLSSAASLYRLRRTGEGTAAC
ncbi:3-oxoacyl-ACP synthase III family protein [Streptomyces sp. PR69]|uniref:3-oxoacyl-ACP synthase III family protein n=1 Tax=Streptomyces sp. PR69 TaxID=2984950 RepID=UPI0022645B93|nr:3-oxoacyl-[acyl-carrier-protein] synthase III C-terminal domain-containing protein [Streptomyces sp. PR69]